jgi:hypothetical protein
MNDISHAQRRYDNLLPEDFEYDEPDRLREFRGWRLIKEKLVRARIEHECFLCGRTIAKGETYTRIFGIYEGLAKDECQCRGCTSQPDVDYGIEDE